MSLYRPSELFAFLDSIDARPKKSLSQNFLIDGNIIAKLTSGLPPKVPLLEIGPGPGAITEYLLQKGHPVTAIEKDPKLAAALTRLPGLLSVRCADILDADLSDLAEPFHIIANLPFQITTPVLTRFVPLPSTASLTLIVQKEVAERITGKEKSSLTLFIEFYATASYLFTISPNSFAPRPKIAAAAIRICPRKPLSNDPATFFTLVRTAFQARRKQLKSSLSTLYPKADITKALTHLNLKETARPEELSAADFIGLQNALGPPEPSLP